MSIELVRLNSLSRRRLLALCVVLFVVAGGLVGYASQSSSILNPSGYGVVNGPMVPGVDQQVATFSRAGTPEIVPAGSYSTSFGGRMVELEGYVTIQVDDAKAASDQVARLAASLNGYVASSSFDDTGSSASIILRVPEANFTFAMQSLSNLGSVKAQSISSNDVTEQYVNLQAQLDSYMTEETALLRILNSSTTVKEALDTENAIQNVQSQINSIQGELRAMQRLVAFATINLQLTEPPKNPTLDFSDALNSALAGFYTVTKGMLILGASLFPIAMVGGVVYIPYRHFSRKKQEPIGAK